jgi:hypothetical protein
MAGNICFVFIQQYLFLFFYILKSVHRNIIPNYSQQNATFLDLFIFTDALHVSGGTSAHHQEHITVHTASGIVNQYSCYRGRDDTSAISSTVAASSSIG